MFGDKKRAKVRIRAAAVDPGLIHCRRVDASFTVAQHRDCPYCFGKEADVQTGDHAKFCDFKPGVDPIHFGFPTGYGRSET